MVRMPVLRRAFFCLHLAFLGTSVVFLANETVVRAFSRFEHSVNQLVGLSQTDFIRGYVAIWAASILAVGPIWLVVGLCAHIKSTHALLRIVGAILTILAPPLFWVFFYSRTFWPVGWPYEWAPVEMIIAIACALLVVSRKARLPTWAALILAAAHYAYWYFVPGSNPMRPNYMGPAGPLLEFCASALWVSSMNSDGNGVPAGSRHEAAL